MNFIDCTHGRGERFRRLIRVRVRVRVMLVFPFCFEYSYISDDSKHFSDEIVENDFAYFILENYEQSCRNVKEVLKRRE